MRDICLLLLGGLVASVLGSEVKSWFLYFAPFAILTIWSVYLTPPEIINVGVDYRIPRQLRDSCGFSNERYGWGDAWSAFVPPPVLLRIIQRWLRLHIGYHDVQMRSVCAVCLDKMGSFRVKAARKFIFMVTGRHIPPLDNVIMTAQYYLHIGKWKVPISKPVVRVLKYEDAEFDPNETDQQKTARQIQWASVAEQVRQEQIRWMQDREKKER